MDNQHSLDLFNSFIEFMKEKHNIDIEDISRIIHKNDKLPITIFNKKLSSYESIVKYMKENLNFTSKQVSEILNKNQGSVSNTYRNSKIKHPETFKTNISSISIPFSAFYKELTTFESVVYHLKENHNLNYRKVASLLERNERTIWTIYQKAKNKLGWIKQ